MEEKIKQVANVKETKMEKAEEEKKVEKSGKEEKKKEALSKKYEAVTNGKDLHISTKHSIAICNFIKKQKINRALKRLSMVIEKKIAVPMKGEIPHRKGIERGRYPIKAAGVFIKLLKNLAANSDVNGIEDPIIVTAKADRAARPHRRFGSRRFKRTNVILIARSKEEKEKKKEANVKEKPKAVKAEDKKEKSEVKK